MVSFPLPDTLIDSLSINVIDNWTNGMKMDERLFTLANIIKKETSNKDLAKEYYELIIHFYNDSEYINEVYFSLQHLDYNKNWKDSLLLYIKEKNDLIEEYEPRTGGDVIKFRNLFGKNIEEVYVKGLIVIVANDLPSVDKGDNAFQQRLITLRVKSKFVSQN